MAELDSSSLKRYGSVDHKIRVAAQLKDRSFLAAARTQLDTDHFSLEKINERLVEYLAVVRLKELNAEREISVEQSVALEEEVRVNAEAETKSVTGWCT
jgi:ATP-dependent Lon protease